MSSSALRRWLLALAVLALIPSCNTRKVFVPLSIPAQSVTSWPIDIQAGVLSGALTLNGANFPANGAESGNLRAWGAQPEDQFLIGSTVGSQYSAMVVNGTYDLFYAFNAGGAVVPENEMAKVLSGVVVNGDTTQAVDVPKVTVGATLTLNSTVFPASVYNSGRFYLQPAGTNELIFLSNSHVVPGSIRVVPGQYHVIYDYRQGDLVPINKLARVMSDVVINSDTVLNINVPTSTLSPTITLNGGAFPLNEYEDGNIILHDNVSGSDSPMFDTKEPLASLMVIHGNYDILYQHETGGAVVPVNASALLVDDLPFTADSAVVHDIVTQTVDFNVTHNGAAFPVSEYEDGNVYLHDPVTQADTLIGNTHDPLDQIVLIPGTYDFHYSHETGGTVPQNERGEFATGVVVNAPTLDLDVISHLVTVDLTHNGDPFPASEYSDATIFLAGPPSSEDILAGNTHDGQLTVRVLPGTYDLLYRHETGEDVPQNTNYRILTGQVINGDANLAADLTSGKVRLTATLNGAAFPIAMNVLTGGRIFASSGAGESILLHRTWDAAFSVELIDDTYDLFYQYAGGNTVPTNAWVNVGNETLP